MVKNLKKLREEKNISQKALADIISVSQQAINKYENHNIEPDINTLCLLADFFDTSVDYLIGHSSINHRIEEVTICHLNHHEQEIINGYRKLTPSEKNSIQVIIENYNLK